jgi:uncharacterized OB-fold protein
MVACPRCGKEHLVFFGDDHVCWNCFSDAKDDEKDKAMYHGMKWGV